MVERPGSCFASTIRTSFTGIIRDDRFPESLYRIFWPYFVKLKEQFVGRLRYSHHLFSWLIPKITKERS